MSSDLPPATQNVLAMSIGSSAHAHGPSLQLIYDTAPIGLAFLSPDCRYLRINQHLTEICGISVEGHLGRTVRECVPGLADAVEGIVASILKTGEPVIGVEVAGQRADQTKQRYWVTYWHPVYGEGGVIVGINVAAQEVTERRQAEEALRENELQFRSLADAMPQLVWMSDETGRIFWVNRQLADFSNVPAGAIPGRDWLDVLRPDRGGEAWGQTLATGEPFEEELRLTGRDGEERAFLTRIVPMRGKDAVIDRWVGTHIDITELKGREEHMRLIADEISHRSKNLLTVVMAIAQQTAGEAADVGEYYARFAARLTALGHCHALLVRDNWQGAPLRDLVEGQLKPFGEVSGGRIEAEGPPIILAPGAVQYLGLALHELATNASKYGALARDAGRVRIDWQVDAATGAIRVGWRERAVQGVTPPKRRGFGRVVLEQIVPRALKGIGALEYRPEGVAWSLEFPGR